MRLPTSDELNAAFAEQEAAEHQRYQAAKPAERARAVEYVPPITGVVDVSREPLPPRPSEPEPPHTPPTAFFCPECGLVFEMKTYKTVGMTKMAITRHRKHKHPKPIEVSGV